MASEIKFTNAAISKGGGVVNLTYDFAGLDLKSKEAVKQFGNFRFEFGEIGRSFAKYNKQEFTLKGNGKYEPLSKKYAAFKRKLKPNAPILVFDGRLRDSLTEPERNPDSIIKVTNLTMERGTKVPYAGNLQEGTEYMPARPFYIVDEGREQIVYNIINAGVQRRVTDLNNMNK